MVTTDMLKKMRPYYHFVKKQQKHKEAFDVHPVRAVLIETTDEERGEKLMEPIRWWPGPTSGSACSGLLFWFTISPLFTGEPEDEGNEQSTAQAIARYLQRPEIVFKDIWAMPDRTKHSLSDEENS